MLQSIHPNPLVALATVLFGLTLGIALALSDWKSKFAIGGIVTTVTGSITTLTSEKVAVVKEFLESSALLTPILYCLNIALGMFVLTLVSGIGVVFVVNFILSKRRSDPEAFVKSVRRAVAILGSGLYQYVTAQPDLLATNKIKELEKHADTLSLIQNTLANEICTNSSPTTQHFKDSVDALGRLLLQHSFGESPDLQNYRMAFFQRQGNRLEYMVAINNRDWTAHSMKGFDLERSFVGLAIKLNRPLIYPKDKKLRTPFVKRKGSRYKSFLAIPVPCGQTDMINVGAITIDYVGEQSVFTDLRVNEVFAFSQFVHALYLLNVKESKHVS